MGVEKIFYILGSVFFGIAIFTIFVLLFYLIRILRNFSRTSSAIWDGISNLKKKIDRMSTALAMTYTLAEKFAKAYFRKKGAKKVAKEENENKK